MPEKNNPDKILSELEKRRDLKGWISIVATVVAVSAALFHLYTAAGGQLFALSQRAVHLAFIGFLGFLYYPFLPKKSNKVPIYDMFLSLRMCRYHCRCRYNDGSWTEIGRVH